MLTRRGQGVVREKILIFTISRIKLQPYRISSNNRRGTYLIFVILGAALIRGQRLFWNSRFQISNIIFAYSMDLIESLVWYP